MTDVWIAPDTTLQGDTVRLEPLSLDHAEPLLVAAQSPETFRYFSRSPAEWTVNGFRAFFAMLIDNEFTVPFCIVHVDSSGNEQPIGVTTFLDIRPAHHGCEIGWTWLAPKHRGTRTNPEMKRLMLAHAFDDRAAIRVQFKTDARNIQSQRAIEKLGAQKEGVLRNHVIMTDGHYRSTVMYSITANQWPTVRDQLDARLSQLPIKT